VVHGVTDKEGWIYGFDFSRLETNDTERPRNIMKETDFVRRRSWVPGGMEKQAIRDMREGSLEFKNSRLNSLIDDFANREGQHTVWTVTYPAGVAYRSKPHANHKLTIVGPQKGDRVSGVVLEGTCIDSIWYGSGSRDRNPNPILEGKDGIWYVKCDDAEDRYLPLCTPGGVSTMEIIPPWKLEKESWAKEEALRQSEEV